MDVHLLSDHLIGIVRSFTSKSSKRALIQPFLLPPGLSKVVLSQLPSVFLSSGSASASRTCWVQLLVSSHSGDESGWIAGLFCLDLFSYYWVSFHQGTKVNDKLRASLTVPALPRPSSHHFLPSLSLKYFHRGALKAFPCVPREPFPQVADRSVYDLSLSPWISSDISSIVSAVGTIYLKVTSWSQTWQCSSSCLQPVIQTAAFISQNLFQRLQISFMCVIFKNHSYPQSAGLRLQCPDAFLKYGW